MYPLATLIKRTLTEYYDIMTLIRALTTICFIKNMASQTNILFTKLYNYTLHPK